jgi:anti-sigma regulatory factor (Ser/Thr protein kinase)
VSTPLTLRLPRRPEAVVTARRAAERLGADLPSQVVADLRLVVSELVTNAVRHGTGDEVELRLTVDGAVVRGEVIDAGEGFVPPPSLLPASDVPGGRGLVIVDRVTNGWGVLEGSTHVWFEVRAR